MNLKILVSAIVLGCSAVTLVGCAHQGHERTTGERIDDATVTTLVKSALLQEKDVKSFDIKVETFDGVVQLAGFVDSQWQIDKAVQVASAVNGVKRVRNDLVHKPN